MDPTWEETSPAEMDRAPASAGPPPVISDQASAAAPPAWEDTQEAPQAAAPAWEDTSDLQGKYGTLGQQSIAGAEALGRGVLGPIATGAERLAGVSPEGMRLREAANPWTSGISEATGFIAPALLTMGASAEAQGAVKALTLPGLVGKIGAGAEAAAPIAKTSARLGAELMAMQGGSEISKALMEDPNQTVGTALTNIGLSGVIGGTLGVPLGLASTAWEKIAAPAADRILTKIKADWGMGNPLGKEDEIVSPLVKQALNLFGGVSKENMEAYAENREAIMAAPEFHEVYGNALEHLLDMQENLDTKKATAASAKSDFKDFLDQQKLSIKQAGYDASSADTLAKQALKEAQTRIGIGLQDGALEAAPKAFSAVQKLRTQAMDLSKGARDILDNTPGELSLKPIFEAIRPMQDELYAKGFPGMAEDLGKTMDTFGHQYGDTISYPNAKSMIQGLQQRGTWNMLANDVAQGTRPYYNRLSGIMNEALKDAVPAYRSAMEPTAKYFDLLSKLDKYGSPESANKAALGLKNVGNYTNEMPMLRDLESKTGINFTTQFEQYANPSVRDSMTKAMPEYAHSLRTAEALQQLKDPEVRAALEKAPYLSQSYKKLTTAETMLDQQLARKAELARVTPNTLESKMKSVMAGRGMAARRALEKIPGMEDMTIPEVLDLINTRQAFEKGAMNGSRNVNLISKLTGGIGGAIGTIAGGVVGQSYTGAAVGGGLGAGAGAILGGIMDKDGPAIVRYSLDKYLDKYGDLPKAMGGTADQARAALAHFLGVDKTVDSKAFKSMMNYLGAVKSGSKFLKNGAEAIFQGSKTVPNHIWSDKDKTKKLNDQTKALKVNEGSLLNAGGNLGHYMPDHGAALATTVARAVSYINQNRPMPIKQAPLDDEIEPSKESVYAFNRGLQIAQQPMTVFEHVKDNTLLPDDVQHLNAMYPDLYRHMKSHVTDALTKYTADGKKVPYSLRQSLSLFLGQTMDSSLAQPNIMAAQGVFQAQKMSQAAPSPSTAKKNMSKDGGMAQEYRTAEQSAQARKSRPS